MVKKPVLRYEPARECEPLTVLASGEVPESWPSISVARGGMFWAGDGILRALAAQAAIDNLLFDMQANGMDGRANGRALQARGN